MIKHNTTLQGVTYVEGLKLAGKVVSVATDFASRSSNVRSSGINLLTEYCHVTVT